ncbi:hypothetical protein [Phytohabitans aurantiacus]|jgi:hypothetical protein|uniref:Ferritin-like domain-containing protein n=1 Tax=Phytohabitans aurantiacus TaxID=3016789 RepID=A0ABQ5R4G6_9ACTN|nr:hypothetical protein [Phytohabitans aurantiacus]GLI01243.1 hypothetical protein Pa4123_65190 [Phytohabitans aurantiacus]
MSFNLDTYKREAKAVIVDDIDFDDFRDQPLSPEALRCLHYMTDVETHTVCYLRDLLVTPSHQNPRITTFLTMWNFEEFWHGDVIDRVLAVHDEINGLPRHESVRVNQGFSGNVLAPITQCLAAAVIGEDFIATHMTWGAVNEWSAHAAYGRLIELEQHATLTKILQRIQQQESRHLAFYMTEARERLERSRRAQRITRFALKRFWAPVGSTITTKAETQFILRYLFQGGAGSRMVRMLDQKVDKLPGQEGLSLVSKSVAKFGVSVA